MFFFPVWSNRRRSGRDDGTRTDEFNVKNLNQRFKRKHILLYIRTVNPLTPHKGSFFNDVTQILIFFDPSPRIFLCWLYCHNKIHEPHPLRSWRHFLTTPKRRMVKKELAFHYNVSRLTSWKTSKKINCGKCFSFAYHLIFIAEKKRVFIEYLFLIKKLERVTKLKMPYWSILKQIFFVFKINVINRLQRASLFSRNFALISSSIKMLKSFASKATFQFIHFNFPKANTFSVL